MSMVVKTLFMVIKKSQNNNIMVRKWFVVKTTLCNNLNFFLQNFMFIIIDLFHNKTSFLSPYTYVDVSINCNKVFFWANIVIKFLIKLFICVLSVSFYILFNMYYEKERIRREMNVPIWKEYRLYFYKRKLGWMYGKLNGDGSIVENLGQAEGGIL